MAHDEIGARRGYHGAGELGWVVKRGLWLVEIDGVHIIRG